MNAVEILRGMVLFIMALVLSGLVTAFVLLSAVNIVKTPQFYKQVLDESNVFPELAETLGSQIELPEARQALGKVITPTFLRTRVFHVIDNLFSYLNGEVEEADLTISLKEVKPVLVKELTKNSPMLENLAEEQREAVLEAVAAAANEQVPDSLNLIQDPQAKETLATAKQVFTVLNNTYIGLCVALVVFVLLVFLMSWNVLRGMKWSGFGIALGSLLSLTVLASLPALATQAVAQSGQDPVFKLAEKIAGIALQKISSNGFPYAIGLFILGAALLAIGFLWKPKKEAATPATSVSLPDKPKQSLKCI